MKDNIMPSNIIMQEIWKQYDYAAPDWLPNWKKKKEYPKASLSKQSFAWEFLRRDPIYQWNYRKIDELCITEGVEQRYKAECGYYIPLSPEELDDIPDSLHFRAELYQTSANYGWHNVLFDPSYKLGESACYPWIKRIGSYKLPTKTTTYHAGGLLIGPQVIPLEGQIIPTENEILHLFDLSLPISPQIKIVKDQLEESQRKREGKLLKTSKTEHEKFPLLLRLLDADAQGADESLIGEILFPEEDIFSHITKTGEPYNNDSHRSPRADALRDARKGAYKLMQRDHKLLI